MIGNDTGTFMIHFEILGFPAANAESFANEKKRKQRVGTEAYYLNLELEYAQYILFQSCLLQHVFGDSRITRGRRGTEIGSLINQKIPAHVHLFQFRE